MASDPNDPTRGGVHGTSNVTGTGTTGGTHGTSRVEPVGAPVEKKTNWLPWLLAALGLLALLFLLSRCNERDETTTAATTTTTTTEQTTQAQPLPDVSGETAAAGTAAAAGAATGNALEDMRAYLASQEAVGRRFTFDNINFATNSAELPADAQPVITGVAQLLQANPNARIRVEGYADARGGAGANAQLGAQRAQAVAQALTAAGIAQDRIETATGGEQNPVDTNATTQGQADNRRTDIVVTAK